MPVQQCVFDVAEGGVDEKTVLVPRAALHPDCLVDHAKLAQLAVTDGDGCEHSQRRHEKQDQ